MCGSPAFSDTDFRAAATELEHGIDGVLSRFQLRWSQFVDDRTAAAPYPRQVLGCLSPSISRTEFADASIYTISILPHYSQWPYETGQILSLALSQKQSVQLVRKLLLVR